MVHGRFAENLIGKRFGNLVVVERLPNDKRGAAVWECKCDDGRTRITTTYFLNSGKVTDCKGIKKQSKKYIGDRHGMLEVIDLLKINGQTGVKYRCDCGNIGTMSLHSWHRSTRISCGCAKQKAREEREKKLALAKEKKRLKRKQEQYFYKPKIDFTGKTIGHLTVKWLAGVAYSNGKRRRSLWYCECSCGKGVIRGGATLKKGGNLSCGCSIHDKRSKAAIKGNKQRGKLRKKKVLAGIKAPERRAIEKKDGIDFDIFKDAVKKKYYGVCDICGERDNSRKDGMHVHHLKSFLEHRELRLLPANSVYLCRKHHMDFHKQYGFQNATIKNYLAYKKACQEKEGVTINIQGHAI